MIIIKPGDRVIHKDFPEKGPAICTYISYDVDTAFVVWGKIGSPERFTDKCNIPKLTIYDEKLHNNVS